MIERFRKWFEFECDRHAKAVTMLESVPAERRDDQRYAQALSKLSHLATARQIWLYRMGHGTMPAEFFPPLPLPESQALWQSVETLWRGYLSDLTESELGRSFEYRGFDGKDYRWTVEEMLTHLFGHGYYHRGQIATLAAALGGKTFDTDYSLWPGAGRVNVS